MASSKIVVDTFNGIQSKIASILGAPSQSTLDLGYNLTVNSTPVSSGSIIYGNDANKAIGDINTIIQHQTGTPTALALFSPGQLITSTDLSGLSAAADSAFTNRNSVSVDGLSTINSDSYSDGQTWSTYRIHSITLDWGSNNKFRGWGNLAGFITIGASFSGGSGTPQTNSWSQLLQSVGTVVFSADAAIQENDSRQGVFSNGGLYNILQNGQVGANAGIAFKILATDTNYTGNQYKLTIVPYGGTNAYDCTGFTLTAIFSDPHLPPDHTTSDFVDSEFTWSVNTYYAFSTSPTALNATNSLS
jgi:hypothetical protein